MKTAGIYFSTLIADIAICWALLSGMFNSLYYSKSEMIASAYIYLLVPSVFMSLVTLLCWKQSGYFVFALPLAFIAALMFVFPVFMEFESEHFISGGFEFIAFLLIALKYYLPLSILQCIPAVIARSYGKEKESQIIPNIQTNK